MKINDLQEIIIETFLNTRKQDISEGETIGEQVGIDDIEADGNCLFIYTNDGTEFEVKIKKN
jgi:hypothetical protein